MPGKRKNTMDIRDVLRRIRQGQSDRAIAKEIGINRKTVGRYHTWAQEQGLLDGELPALDELQRLVEKSLNNDAPPQNESSVEPYRALVVKLRQQGVEIAATHERLRERGYDSSYASVYRFVRVHSSLRVKLPQPVPTRGSGSPKKWEQRTPAMAAGLTDHAWSLEKLLMCHVPAATG